MDQQLIGALLIILVSVVQFCSGQYEIPEVKLEAFTPRGFRISIPAEKGVEVFAFHGKINKPIKLIEPGDISYDVTKPTNGRYTYTDPNIRLKINDVFNYWVFVQHDRLGFRKDDLTWTVDKLLPLEDIDKEVPDSTSITKVGGRGKVSIGETIINDQFSDNAVNSEIWEIEQYIPGNPDWQFNIYRNSPDVISVESDVLRITPKLEEANANKTINLDPGCTRKDKSECKRPFVSIYNPPIVSGKLRSKKSFCFGNVTLRAKLPIGDYLYPEIYLEDATRPQRRILIAYARGNQDYIRSNGVDDGGKKLFGGPHTDVVEPSKSKFLSSFENTELIGAAWHTFNLIWTPNLIELFMDGNHYGHQEDQVLRKTGFNDYKMMNLVLGVGAGGPYQFPDGYTSSGRKKPYGSTHPTAIKEFLSNKDTWVNTWTGDNQLQIDYVSVTAL